MPDLPRDRVVMCSGSNSAGALSSIDAGGLLLPHRAARPLAGARTGPARGRGQAHDGRWCSRPPTRTATTFGRRPHGRAAGPAPEAHARAGRRGADATAVVTRASRAEPRRRSCSWASRTTSRRCCKRSSPGARVPRSSRSTAATVSRPPISARWWTPPPRRWSPDSPAPHRRAPRRGSSTRSPAGCSRPAWTSSSPRAPTTARSSSVSAAVAAKSDDADAIRTHLAPLLRGACRLPLVRRVLAAPGRRTHDPLPRRVLRVRRLARHRARVRGLRRLDDGPRRTSDVVAGHRSDRSALSVCGDRRPSTPAARTRSPRRSRSRRAGRATPPPTRGTRARVDRDHREQHHHRGDEQGEHRHRPPATERDRTRHRQQGERVERVHAEAGPPLAAALEHAVERDLVRRVGTARGSHRRARAPSGARRRGGPPRTGSRCGGAAASCCDSSSPCGSDGSIRCEHRMSK